MQISSRFFTRSSAILRIVFINLIVLFSLFLLLEIAYRAWPEKKTVYEEPQWNSRAEVDPDFLLQLKKKLDSDLKKFSLKEYLELDALAFYEGIDYSKKTEFISKYTYRSRAFTRKSMSLIYDVEVNIDEFFQRKHSTLRKFPLRGNPIYLLGDSFVFGDGVEDFQTLSWLLQIKFPDRFVVNMGEMGASPGGILWGLKYGEKRFKTMIQNGSALLIYAPWHLDREDCNATGFWYPEHEYLLEKPYWVLRNDSLKYLGKCGDQKWRSVIFRLMGKSRVFRSFGNFGQPSDSDRLKKMTSLILEIQKTLRKNHGIKDFSVIMYPVSNPEENANVGKVFRKAGIEVYDLSSLNLWRLTGGNPRIPGDHHPSFLANRVIAEFIADYLEYRRPRIPQGPLE